MPTELAVRIAALVILILLSGFFSSAETALTTVNRIHLKTLADEGSKKAALVLKILEQQDKMLAAILIGNNIVNLSASSLATTVAIDLFGSDAVGVVTGVLTLVVLIFGEIAPKNAASINAERLSLKYARIIHVLMVVMTPVIFIINHLARGVMFLMGVRRKTQDSTITTEELRTLVDVGHEEGVIENEERRMINNVFDFGDAQAKEIMVPRADIFAVSVDDSYDTVAAVYKNERFSRLPVYRDDKDHIVGIINIKDFAFVQDRGAFHPSDIMYDPYYTYETKSTSQLLLEMREKSKTVTIVLDEYGGAVGMITLEDLLEELVGEIRDEYDRDEDDLIQKVQERTYLVEGSVKIDDLNEQLGLELDSENYDSIGGYMIEQLDHLPEQGESVRTDEGILLTAEKMNKNRIERIRMVLPRTMQVTGPASETAPQADPSALAAAAEDNADNAADASVEADASRGAAAEKDSAGH